MQFRVLGSLEVLDAGQPVALGGVRQRAVLAVLLLHHSDTVSVDRLVDALWGERPPAAATKTVQVYVSRLRKVLGQDALVTRGGGYALEIEPEQLDSHRFERMAAEGREALASGDARAARPQLEDALRLWRGEALADLAYEPFAQGEIARLQELRLSALESRIEADLGLGRHAALVPELEALVREHPARERLRAQLMLALYRSGRQAEALESYHDARRVLVEELGLEPSRELRELERAILAQDRGIDAPAPTKRRPDAPRRRRAGVLIAVGGAALLAAAVAAVVAGGEDDSARAFANSLAVIDPDSNQVVAAIPTGIRPADVTAGAGYVWVANQGDDTATQVDPRRRVVVSTTPPGVTVGGLAAGAGGLWVGDARRSRLVRIDPGFRSVVRSFRLTRGPELHESTRPNPVAVGHDSVWVGSGYGTVARVNPETAETVKVAVGNSPTAIATGEGAVWVADDWDNNVSRIDPGSANAVSGITPLGGEPSAVAAGSGAVWVAKGQDDTVARVDPSAGTVTDTIRVGRRPTGVAVGAGSVWVANSLSGTVSRIDPATRRVEETVEVGAAPQGVTVAHGLVWVSVQQRTAPPPSEGARGGVARLFGSVDPGPFDPALDSDFQRITATCALLYNYPDRPYPEGARLRPEVARGPPSVSADGLTYEFELRRGYRFSPPSNHPVTAEAFERALERALSPKVASFGGQLVGDITGADEYAAGRARRIAGVRADGNSLVIHLTRPAPNLTSRLAAPYFCAVPPDTPITSKGVDGPPAAGPYYVASHVQGRSLVLRRNPNYPGPRPQRLAEIRFTLGYKPDRAVAAVETGRADYVVLEPPGQPGASAGVARRLERRYGPGSDAADRGRRQLFTQPAASIYSFAFNTRRGLFVDARLRRAVNYAIDRRALAAHTGGGEQGRPTDQFLLPGFPGFEDAAIYPLGGPNLQAARRLAGDERRHAVLYTCSLPGCIRHGEILRSNLRAIGIELDVRTFNLGDMFGRIEKPNEPFDITYWNWFSDYADPFSFINLQFGSDDALIPNLSLQDARMQRRMAAAASLSGDVRLRAYARLDRDLAAQSPPAAPFATGTTTYFFSARMGCQVLHPIYGLNLPSLCIRRR